MKGNLLLTESATRIAQLHVVKLVCLRVEKLEGDHIRMMKVKRVVGGQDEVLYRW